RGAVYAVDIRRLPLRFLWVRSLIRSEHNIRIVLGEPDNPHLPNSSVDAVLLANTYHEMDNPAAILNHVFQALVPGGRLVIVDPAHTEQRNASVDLVEGELRNHGFEIIHREEQFLTQPGRGPWWLIVAHKP